LKNFYGTKLVLIERRNIKMKRFIAVAAAFCLLFIASAMTPSANAQNGDRKSVVTFSEPVEIPGGTVLPAGTYFFKLLNQDSGRWVVQIFNQNQTHTFATVITVQDFRYHTTDKGVMTFAERPDGQPPAIKEWFFPGENFGRRFVYPKNRALQLAKQVNEPVLSMQGDTAAVAPDTTTDMNTFAQTPVTAYSATGEEVAPSTFVQTQAEVPASAPATVAAPVQDTTPAVATDLPLPKTASSDPAVGLIGLIAMVGAVGLAMRRRRSA
jgi:LPXTG-motif cell wall-anchored protein